jgi:hypothetical protein
VRVILITPHAAVFGASPNLIVRYSRWPFQHRSTMLPFVSHSPRPPSNDNSIQMTDSPIVRESVSERHSNPGGSCQVCSGAFANSRHDRR